MTMKKLSTGTFITLALATSLTFGLMSIHSAKAKTNLNTITSSVPSAASLSAQISGVTVYFLGAGNNVLYVLRPGSEVANRVGVIGPVNGTVTEGDFRTATNQLYVVTNTGNFYTVNLANAQATRVATLSPNNNTSRMLDINPMADAFRWIGTNELNYAIVKGANGVFNTVAVQTPVAYIRGDLNAGANPNIVGGAYDNNQKGLATTTFYFVDSATNQFGTINDRTATGSSNTGGGRLQTVGPLFDQRGRVNITPTSGFDIATFPQLGNLNIGLLVTDGKVTTVFTTQIPNTIQVGSGVNLGGFSQPLVGSDGQRQFSDVMIPIQQ
jgi:dipeptidyl aminopeptidase/acylaminoacyl peptidase